MRMNIKETLLIKAEEAAGRIDSPAVKAIEAALTGFMNRLEKAGVFTPDQTEEFSVIMGRHAVAHFDEGMSLGFETGKNAVLGLLNSSVSDYPPTVAD